MSPEDVSEAARLLVAARASFERLPGLPDPVRPETVDEGYEIQTAFSREWGLDLVGYKIACTSRDQQRLVGVKEPFSGRIFSPFLFESPARISARHYHMLGVESEFAFRLRRALPPRRKPYTRDQVARAVATLHPAIEIVDSRFEDWTAQGAPSLVADNAANGALVIGTGIKDWRKYDLAKHRVRLDINGKTVARGTGRRVLGHPLEGLVWLANDLSRRGEGIEAGHVVTTGTCTGLNFAAAGDEAVADFGVLGQVQVSFTD